MKSFFQSIKISFVIIGTVIGAGFLSGKEIVQFFYGSDMFLTSVAVFILFFIGLIFLLSASKYLNSKLYSITRYLILMGNLVILSGMLSAVETLFNQVINWNLNFPIYSIITLLFSNIVMFKGTKGLEKVNLFLVPLIILILILCIFQSTKSTIVTTGTIQPFSIFAYVGMNLFLAIPVLNGLGQRKSKSVLITSAAISSLILASLIFFVLSCLNGADNNTLFASLPIMNLLNSNKILKIFYSIILYFGIITTLLSAHYPLYNYFEDDNYGVIGRIFISIIAFLLSRVGFYNIVAFIYPVIGVIGALIIIIFAFQSISFLNTQRQSTSRLPKSKE